MGKRLVALDAQTGLPVRTFGKDGVVDLTQGLGRNIEGLIFADYLTGGNLSGSDYCRLDGGRRAGSRRQVTCALMTCGPER